jgi:hypothetical protein
MHLLLRGVMGGRDRMAAGRAMIHGMRHTTQAPATLGGLPAR